MSLFAPSPTATLKARYGEHYRWLLLMAVMVGTIASLIPSTSVNVAIPAMSAYFHIDQARAQWITSAFMIASTVAMLVTPWMLSRFGYRETYTYAIGLLLLGGLVGGFAQHFEVLLASRVAEGLAAGIIQPIPAVIILRAFKPSEQGRAGGMFGMGVVLAPAIAPALGGVLVDWMGWRSTFFMLVPFCLLSLWLAWKLVPTSSPDDGGPAGGHKLDVLGLLLITISTFSLLNALVAFHHSHGWAEIMLALAAGCLVLFVLWQSHLQRTGRKSLIDLRLFRFRSFVMGCIVAFIYGTAMFGSTYLLPLFIQMGLGLSAGYAGSLLLPAGLVLAVTIPIVGRMADKQPTHWLVSIGMLLLAASFGLMLWVQASTALWLLASVIVLGRIGMGFILPSLNLGAMRPLDKALISHGASTISFVRMLGGAIGVGLCGIVLEWRLAAQALHPELSALEARVAAFHESFAMLTVLCLLAFLAATQLRSPIDKAAA